MVYHAPMVEKLLAQELANPYPAVVRIVGVKIRDRGEVKKFDAGEASLVMGDRVLLEVAGELSYGVVCFECAKTDIIFFPAKGVQKKIPKRGFFYISSPSTPRFFSLMRAFLPVRLRR